MTAQGAVSLSRSELNNIVNTYTVFFTARLFILKFRNTNRIEGGGKSRDWLILVLGGMVLARRDIGEYSGVLEMCNMFLKKPFNLSVTVDTRCYFILVSGAPHSAYTLV